MSKEHADRRGSQPAGNAGQGLPVAKDAQLTIDGKVAKFADYKKEWRFS
jgi:hypothetical protein